MEIFFADPSEIPLPPDEVRIRELRAEPWPDGRRVRVTLEVDAFQKRPSADLVIQDSHGEAVAHASIIESIDRKMEATLHLRGAVQEGDFVLIATLYYVTLVEADDGVTGASPGFEPIQRQIVDQAQIEFELPAL